MMDGRRRDSHEGWSLGKGGGGVVEQKMEIIMARYTLGFIRIMEKNMETTIIGYSRLI